MRANAQEREKEREWRGIDERESESARDRKKRGEKEREIKRDK